jgi:hypothetical protein
VNHNDERDYEEETANRREMESERDTQSFTAMSNEAIDAVIKAQQDTGEKYPMELNSRDFRKIMLCLKLASDHHGGTSLADWADSFASGIASTLGIEMI